MNVEIVFHDLINSIKGVFDDKTKKIEI